MKKLLSQLTYKRFFQRGQVVWTFLCALAVSCWLLTGCALMYDKKVDPKTGATTWTPSAAAKGLTEAAEAAPWPYGAVVANIAWTLLNTYATWKTKKALEQHVQG